MPHAHRRPTGAAHAVERAKPDTGRRTGRTFLPAGRLVVLAAAAALSALLGWAGPVAATPLAPAQPSAALPAAWQTELPHGGQLADLSAWWQQFDDPALPVLIVAAQDASPTLASAASRIAQADAARVAAGAALGPRLDGSASASRSRPGVGQPQTSAATVGLQASWELDLFGGQQAARQAALARLAGAQADWHEARVSLAAEVAEQLLALRVCEQQAQDAETEANSRGETARLTGLAQRAGFEAPATAALAQANAAQALLNWRARQVQCGQVLQALVALSGLEPAQLRQQLAPRSTRLPMPAMLAIVAVPASALAQRPDLFSRARALEAAAADVADSRAQQLPRVSLAGSLGLGSLRTAGVSADGAVWSIGPVQVSLPVFDGGRRRASTDAARARYDEAVAAYQSRVRQALREVEDALLRLQGGPQRREDARAAVAGFAQALNATEQRQQAGLASRLELEDARRSLLQARSQQTETEREQVAAWIALYRALGGGWQAPVAPASGG